MWGVGCSRLPRARAAGAASELRAPRRVPDASRPDGRAQGGIDAMTSRPPEGPKADFDAETASESRVPRPPSRAEVNKISEAQGLITDEWTGEPAPGEAAGKAPPKP